MGIFTRVADIISANINAMLDKAEDPEKMVKMMIREMEDTLVEVKASCAGAMAAKKRIEREVREVRARAADWAAKAELAIDKGREDLAREALLEKRRFTEKADALQAESDQCDKLVEQYRADIAQLDEKLEGARERQRVLVQRHIRARQQKRAQTTIRRVDTSDAMARFDHFESRIERMEAEAELVNHGRKPSLDEAFRTLTGDEDLEKELDALKKRKQAN
jgi:phage shock protein A